MGYPSLFELGVSAGVTRASGPSALAEGSASPLCGLGSLTVGRVV